jgi:hypothetical protein
MESLMQTIPRFHRTRPAAEYCGFAKSTFEKMRVYGNGPRFVRRGSAVYYDIRDLDEWLASLPRYDSTTEADAARETERGTSEVAA